MARELPMRVRGWLLAALLINLAGLISGFVADQYADSDWTVPLRGVLLLANIICLATFGVKWWRWRDVKRTGVEHRDR